VTGRMTSPPSWYASWNPDVRLFVVTLGAARLAIGCGLGGTVGLAITVAAALAPPITAVPVVGWVDGAPPNGSWWSGAPRGPLGRGPVSVVEPEKAQVVQERDEREQS
jgi:hypothetical protein